MQGGFVVSPPRACPGCRPQNDRGEAQRHSVAIGLDRQFYKVKEMNSWPILCRPDSIFFACF